MEKQYLQIGAVIAACLLLLGVSAYITLTQLGPPAHNLTPDEAVITNVTSIGTNTTHVAATPRATATPIPKPTATPTVTPTPTPIPSPVITPTPTPTPPRPTPVPKQCTHVDIIVYHPYGVPCNNCASMLGMLSTYYQGNPYVTYSWHNATSNSVIGVVRETGQTQTFEWGNFNQIEAWTDSVLTCSG